jgi:predicted ArsR family transcriptional regulator
MTVLDAIADPVRLAIVRHLAQHDGASLTDLAAAAGVHANTIRPHLAALQDAGVVTSETGASEGPGRPPLIVRLRPDVTLGATDFRMLAELLAAAVAHGGLEPEQLHDIGAEWGRFMLGRPGPRDAAREVPAALERLGFDARVRGEVVELRSCPCPVVSPQQPGTMCALSMGVIDGVLAASGGGLKVLSDSHDPAARRCQATVGKGRRRRRWLMKRG